MTSDSRSISRSRSIDRNVYESGSFSDLCLIDVLRRGSSLRIMPNRSICPSLIIVLVNAG